MTRGPGVVVGGAVMKRSRLPVTPANETGKELRASHMHLLHLLIVLPWYTSTKSTDRRNFCWLRLRLLVPDFLHRIESKLGKSSGHN